MGCVAHATSAFVDFLLWWKVSSKNAGFSMLNCPNKPHIIGIQWTFGNDTNHWSCQVINSRAEPKNTSSFQHPYSPSWRHSLGMSHLKYQWTPNATPLACCLKGWNFVSRFSLQENKKILGTLSKLVFITLSCCPSFLGSSYFDMNLDCLLFPLQDACSGRG